MKQRWPRRACGWLWTLLGDPTSKPPRSRRGPSGRRLPGLSAVRPRGRSDPAMTTGFLATLGEASSAVSSKIGEAPCGTRASSPTS
jgi:hypothetical protein